MSSEREDRSWTPDVCGIQLVFAVVLTGELLAFVLVLVRLPLPDPWLDLAAVSAFVQWVGLTSIALLCLLRRPLGGLGQAAASLASYALVLLVVAALSPPAYRLFAQAGLEPGLGPAAFLARNLAVAAIVVAVVLRHLYVQGQWRRRLELEALARIQALHSRIRPHFLFNSMNTIASLTRSDPALAERVVEDLAELFRVTLGDARVPARLAEELEVCRRYAAIEQLRLGERLRIVWDLSDAPGDALLPALTLQPLLENAIYHGIEPAPQGGDVVLAVRREAPGVAVTLSNPLCSPGMHGHRDGNRLALDNVRERLLAFFGPGAALDVGPAGGRYWVTLRFPYRRP